MKMKTGREDNGPVRITTERLILREFKEDDWRTIAAYISDPEVARYLLTGQADPEYTRSYVHGAIAQAGVRPRTYFGLAVTLKSEGHLIGNCALSNAGEGGLAQIGWDLNRQYWGCGIMTEAAQAVVDFAFGQLGVCCIMADCFLENRASIRVMEKLGMRHQPLTPEQEGMLLRRLGEQRRMVHYHLFVEMWRQNKGKLL